MDIESTSQITARLIDLVHTAPTWLSCSILFFGAFIEYIFPPFPGDTVLVAGGFFISREAIPLIPSVLALVAGSVIGSAAGWSIGAFAQRKERSRKLILRFIGEANLEKINQTYAKYGNWILIVNRFLPGVRGFFMVGAGITGIPLRKVMIFGVISALLWNTLLIALGFFVSESLPALMNLFEAYTFMMIAIIVGVVIIWFMRGFLRRWF